MSRRLDPVSDAKQSLRDGGAVASLGRLVAGDLDPAAAEAQIRAKFANWRPAGTPLAQTAKGSIDLTRPMSEIRATLSKYPVKTRVSLTGPMVVARDIAFEPVRLPGLGRGIAFEDQPQDAEAVAGDDATGEGE